MEKLKYSILVCVYGNADQFENFLITACGQDYPIDDYEIVVVDNATPGNEIMQACLSVGSWMAFPNIIYARIGAGQKQCRNITQGINIAARGAQGERFVIVADSNVLLSSNLLKEIDKSDDKQIVISGAGTDIKISPDGNYSTEYAPKDHNQIAKENDLLLKAMGWPDDPLDLKLIEGKYREPDPHNAFDVYIVTMHRSQFVSYDKNLSSWGPYHTNYVWSLCMKYGHRRLQNIRIIHQYHRVWKNEEQTETIEKIQ